jgi:hypothetical protein
VLRRRPPCGAAVSAELGNRKIPRISGRRREPVPTTPVQADLTYHFGRTFSWTLDTHHAVRASEGRGVYATIGADFAAVAVGNNDAVDSRLANRAWAQTRMEAQGHADVVPDCNGTVRYTVFRRCARDGIARIVSWQRARRRFAAQKTPLTLPECRRPAQAPVNTRQLLRCNLRASDCS